MQVCFVSLEVQLASSLHAYLSHELGRTTYVCDAVCRWQFNPLC
jgi:hypothetical protein